MVLLVETSDGVDEAVGDTVLVVQVDGLLNGLVSNYVAMSEILSNDAGAGLVLLCNLIAITLGVRSIVAVISRGRCTRDLDLGGAKLSVIEEESGLCSSFLLEDDGSTLGSLSSWDEVEFGDLATAQMVSRCILMQMMGRAYQKEKKSLTSFSLVCKLMFLTLTVEAMLFGGCL